MLDRILVQPCNLTYSVFSTTQSSPNTTSNASVHKALAIGPLRIVLFILSLLQIQTGPNKLAPMNPGYSE
jgi:hypothetical protein